MKTKQLSKLEIDLIAENSRLRSILVNIGYCPDCNSIFVHHEDEPFASCNCGSCEWVGNIPIIQQVANYFNNIDIQHQFATLFNLYKQNKKW